MNKNVAMLRKVGGLGLAGAMVFGAAQTQAETFNVTTDVQNTLAITIVQDMNLGTLFAASATSSAVNSLQLTPAGGFNTPAGIAIEGAIGDAPSFLSLGGQTAARGSVATGEDFTVTLPAGEQATDLTAAADFDNTLTPFTDGDVIEVRIGGAGGDPGVARFYLADFTIGDATADSNPSDNGDGTYSFAPGFGVTTVEFGIGATVYTDGSGARTEYEEGTYEGTFEVTASF